MNPKDDSLFIAQMREKMDQIRLTEHRPTVGLVLSGGGAKGAAHVGVLKYLEEKNIPIDVITGTSMGGLIGGLYALGYPADSIKTMLTRLDWDIMLSDKIDPKYYSYQDKQHRTTYLLTIPFHYENESFNTRILEQERYSKSDADLKFNGRVQDIGTQKGHNTLASSLPSGYVYGFNVNNLFSALSVGYQDSLAFKDLPIPFFCVASDMISCKAKNWGSGSIKTALRSTMSIPGLFDPVRSQGLVLVDGGTRNNFPVDLARAMGADFIIGVDLSDARPSYSQVNNLGDIISQFITMLGKDSFDSNVAEADIFIKPNTNGYNMLSFSPESIDTLITRGYISAQNANTELNALKKTMPKSDLKFQNSAAKNLMDEYVMLEAIYFDGVSNRESQVLMNKIKLKAGQKVTSDDINVAMSILQATGAFESVTYSLLGKEEPYRLVFSCNKAPVHTLALGLRVDSEEWASVNVQLGLNTHKLLGSKFTTSIQLGQSQKLDLRYMLNFPGVPTINVEAEGWRVNANLLNREDKSYIRSTYMLHKEKIYLSNIDWKRLDIQLGAMNTGMILDSRSELGQRILPYGEGKMKGNYIGAFANVQFNTLDARYFPTRGLMMRMQYENDFLETTRNSFKPINAAIANIKFAIPFGKSVAFIPDLHFRAVFDRSSSSFTDEDFSMIHCNYYGGEMEGRYISHQIPFIGFNNVVMGVNSDFSELYDYVSVLNAELRIKLAKKLYLSAMGGFLAQGTSFVNLFNIGEDDIAGAALKISFDGILGPISLKANWSNLYKNPQEQFGVYFSAGFDF